MAAYNLTAICLFYLSFIFLRPVVSQDYVTFLQQFCSEANYDQGSVYQRNLNSLLANLSYEAVTKNFYNYTVGEGVDKVYGLFLCNGGNSNQICQECITAAAGQVQQKCPYDVEAIVFYGQCILRYSNRSIFSIEDVSVDFTFDYGPKLYKQYDQQVSSLFTSLISKAAVDNTSLTFASGMSYATETIFIISYVDCTPDLTPYNCNKCLHVGLERLPMNGRQLGTVVLPSCRLFYLYTDVNPDKPFNVSYIALSAVAAAAAGISFIINFYMCFKKSKSRGKPNGLEEIESMENLHMQFSAIKVATDNFSSSNKIGQGGFGVVYMGSLPDGQAIAVKRLASSSGQGIREFKSEASLAAKLQHKNLVKVYGFCLEGEEKLIVYEFLPNKSLDRFLFDTKRGVHLKWESRQKILMGIARGLLYLHEDSRFRIIHRDLKPSNILLDGEMNPKIADFGMAKLFGSDQTQGNTSRGTKCSGYMAPEYVSTGNFSVKSDVFSFGVILLEIISGQKNRVSELQEEDENLLNRAWRLWNNGDVSILVDPNLGGNYLVSEVTRCIHIGLLCVQEDAARRPTMASILSMLSSQSVILPSLTAPPAFPYRSSIPLASSKSNASNILLDGEMNPKIADFGMAKPFEVGQTQGNTSRVELLGYMAPEYVSSGNFSVKSDIFSYGVLLLEIVSGRRNYVPQLEEEDEGNLLNHASRLWNDGTPIKLLDPNLEVNDSITEVTRCIHIGLLCVQKEAARRPAISSVLSMLSSQSVVLPSPTMPPAFPYQGNKAQALSASNSPFTEEVFTNVHGR